MNSLGIYRKEKWSGLLSNLLFLLGRENQPEPCLLHNKQVSDRAQNRRIESSENLLVTARARRRKRTPPGDKPPRCVPISLFCIKGRAENRCIRCDLDLGMLLQVSECIRQTSREASKPSTTLPDYTRWWLSYIEAGLSQNYLNVLVLLQLLISSPGCDEQE